MANSKEFSHITVTADDDDDVVIQAGAVEEPAAEELVDEATAEDVGDAVEGVAEEDPALPEQGAEVPPTADAKAQGKAGDASYHETTLEDLESAKMSTTQKVIIVVAVLGVIAFAAWYLLAH